MQTKLFYDIYVNVRGVSMIICPHCKQQTIGTGKLPPDVLMILPCPNCNEYSIVFRNRAIPINLQIIQKGTRAQRIEHISSIVENFLDLVLPEMNAEQQEDNCNRENLKNNILNRKTISKNSWAESKEKENDNQESPITEEEVKLFIEKEIDSIDNPELFKKYFGEIPPSK